MNVADQMHPTQDDLVAYLAGKLNAVDSDNIKQHLVACESCCDVLDSLPTDDTIVAALRQQDADTSAAPDVPSGHTVAPTLAPEVEETRAPRGATTEVTGLDADQWKLPPELRDDRRYRIVELLGHGGMGDVYRAEHKVMNRQVALKVIKPQLVQNDAAVRRFRREVQAAARLHHGNIVTAYDAEQAGDLHYLVMEFVDGENLDEVIRERGPLPVEEACEYIRQAAEGLQYAHEQGMVHRDIKPHNLMVTGFRNADFGLRNEEGQPTVTATLTQSAIRNPQSAIVKILDFGLANFANEVAAEELTVRSDRIHPADGPDESGRHEEEPDKSGHYEREYERAASVLQQLTQMGTMMGTPDYMAPEQAQDAHTADIRADIYSLGCTFYTLLTGKAPFSEGSVLDKVKAHTQQTARPPSDFRDDVPSEVEAVLLKMMAKDPAARYQTPQEVVDALRNFIDQRIDEKLRDYEAGRPPSKPLGPATGESDDDIRKWYGQVANVMLSVGLINTVTSLIFVSIIVWLALVGEDYRSFATHWVTLVCIASLVPGILLLTVVGSVRRMENYGRLLLAVFLCMLPTPGAFLGIPMGLVTLFHLLSPDCRPPLGARPRPSLGEHIIFIALLAYPFVLVVAGLVYYMQSGEVDVSKDGQRFEAKALPNIEPSGAAERIVVALKKDGSILVNDRPVALYEMVTRVKWALGRNHDREVFILPDDGTTFARLTKILTWLRHDRVVGARNVQWPMWFKKFQYAELGERKKKLNQIGRALYKYHDEQGYFPPAPGTAKHFDDEGRPYLSWRVHLLPYLGEEELYKQFRLDEPWDSDHNKPLLARIPNVYKTKHVAPFEPTEESTTTTMLAVVGEGTAYEGKAGLNMNDFKDGLDTTAYIVNGGPDGAVPWTKPEDRPFDPEYPMRAFVDLEFPEGYPALMANATSTMIPRSANVYDTTLRGLLTRNAGDLADLPGLRRNNLWRIGVALHAYHDVYRGFPPAAELMRPNGQPSKQLDAEGRPFLSWRVYLLPMLENGQELFDQFHLDEPWDSEHNKKLLDQMPAVFKTTDDPTRTTFLAVVGEGTAYEGKAGLSLKDFRGLFITLLSCAGRNCKLS